MDPRGVRRGPPPPQRSLLLTVGIVTLISVLVVYILVGRHLKKFDDVAVALTERLEHQSSFQASEMKGLISNLLNETNFMSSSLDDMTAMHTEKFSKVSQELRNHSKLVALAIEKQSSYYSEQIQDLAIAVRDSTLGQSGMSMKQIQRLLVNQTQYTLATLHSQRRTEKDLVELLKLIDDRGESGSGFKQSVEDALDEIVTAMQRHTQIQKAAQETLDALSGLLASQKVGGKVSSTTSKEEQDKIQEVLTALVAHLKNQDKEGQFSGSQDQLVHKLDSLLLQLRNQTSLSAISRAVRQQTATITKLKTQLDDIDAKLPLARSTEAESDTQSAVLTLLQEVQKQTKEMKEVKDLLDDLKLATSGGGEAGEEGAAAGGGSVMLTLLQELRNQTKMIARLDSRLSQLEEKAGISGGGAQGGDGVQGGVSEGGGGAGGQKSTEARAEPKVDVSEAGQWTQHEIAGNPTTFLRYSGYRLNGTHMAATGLGMRTITESFKLTKCKWVSRDGSVAEGGLEVQFPSTTQNRQYDVILLLCAFPSPVGSQGGYLSATFDKVEYTLYREEIGQFSTLDPVAPFKHQVTVCVSPVASPPSDLRLFHEFVEFHRLMGVTRFAFFDAGGLGQPFLTSFDAQLKTGLVELNSFKNVDKYDQESRGALLAYHDCIYSSRYNSDWVTFIDANEYLYVSSTRNLLGILKLAKELGKAWMSFGSVWWASQKCAPAPEPKEGEGDHFSVERMVFRWPAVLCHNTAVYPDRRLCLGVLGHRRLVVDPLRVLKIEEYSPSKEDEGIGFHLSTEEMVHFHYQNFLEGPMCSEIIGEEESIEWWYRNKDGQKAAESLRAGQHCNFTSGGTCTAVPESSGDSSDTKPNEGDPKLVGETGANVTSGGTAGGNSTTETQGGGG